MVIILIFLIITHIYLCWKSLAYGCAFMIATRMIFPPLVRIGPVSMNTAFILILLFFCILKQNNVSPKAFFPILKLSLPLAILGLFAPLDYIVQFKNLLQYSITELLPFSLICLSIQNQKDLTIIVKSFFISFIIIGGYGIVTYFIRTNPWVIIWSQFSGYAGELYIGDGHDVIRGALSSRVTGNQPDGPIPWGQICLIVLMFASLYPNIKKRTRIILIILTACNCLLTAKRSIILPMIVLLATLMYYNIRIKTKYIFASISFLIILCCVFSFNKTLHKIYESNIKTSIFFWDDKLAEKNSIRGSSKNMRFEQAIYTNNLIEKNILTGNGFGFTTEFLKKYGTYTNAFAFESIYLWAIANSGYIGLILWCIFFYNCYKRNKNVNSNTIILMIHGCYWLSILLTNIYVSLYCYMIITALLERYRVLYRSQVSLNNLPS